MKSVLQSIIFFFRNLIILDSDVTIHVFNDLSWFSNFKKTSHDNYFLAACSEISILKYENMILWLKKDKILHLKKVIFCTDFVINLMSFRLLKVNKIFWNTVNNTLFQKIDSSIICSLKEITDQQVIKENSSSSILTTQRIQQIQHEKSNSCMFKFAFKNDKVF